MKAARNAAIAVLLISVSAWLAHLHVVAQRYYPVVRLASPDGLTYTAVQEPTDERRACGAANERFLGPIKRGCKDCQVAVARCERELEGFELAVHQGKKIPYPVVSGPGMHMAIAGPDAAAKASCELIADQMVRNGLRSAVCIKPA